MIAIGCDHGGYERKQEVIGYFEENHIEYRDFGCYGKDSCDYPEYGQAVARAVASGECDRGIVICTTGITFLNTEFPGEEKHCRRVAAIQALEEETMK